MKSRYIDLMEKALGAYSTEHMLSYYEDVRTNGMPDQGFPRLTSNLGILIAHGRQQELLPIFTEFMEFCCKTIPTVKAANDFSVREIICCLLEIEASGLVDQSTTARWREYLATIEPTTCYTQFATKLTDDVRNWALFSGVSEYYRQDIGLCSSMDFIEMQLAQQLQFCDENGMYRDNPGEFNHNPIVYDLVPRGLYSMILNRGYRGKSYDRIDNYLKKAGLLTLQMQSVTGEILFGGRSNQFIHNETHLAITMEFEAKRYAREGDWAMAAKFKAGVTRALDNMALWLDKQPIRHVKNRFPTETEYGCEGYAYFDKYMITVASFLYAAYQICDDTIVAEEPNDDTTYICQTSPHFHKLILKSGEYFSEFDLDADPHYDASGLGRIHRKDAPSATCMSCPCPVSPGFRLDIPPMALSLCAATKEKDAWKLGAAEGKYELVSTSQDASSAKATLLCRFAETAVEESYTVSHKGVSVTLTGEGEVGFALPALVFDGETTPEIACKGNALTITYEGWICRYTTNGTITDLNKTAANRNGHYRAFLAHGQDSLQVDIQIVPV